MLALALCLAPSIGCVPPDATCLVPVVQDGEATRATERELSVDEIEEASAEVRFAIELSAEARLRDDLDEARLHLAGALEVLQKVEGARTRALLSVLGELDGAAEQLGVLETQEAAREWALAILVEHLPAEHADRLRAMESLGITRYFQRDFDGAHVLYVAVHEARERSLPADHVDMLTAMTNLALTTYALGDSRAALALQQAILETYERTRPANDRSLLIAKYNLGLTKSALGDARGAIELFEPVLAARRLAPGWPDLLEVMSAIGSAKGDLGYDEEKHELAEAVLRGREKSLPAEHPLRLAAMESLGVAKRALGDYAAAHELFRAVHDVRMRTRGADHPLLLRSKQNLAVTTRFHLGDDRAALPLEQYVYDARARALDADHPDLLSASFNLGLTKIETGDAEGGLELLREVHRRRSAALQADHPAVLRSESALGYALWKVGRRDESLELGESGWRKIQRVLPPAHFRTLFAVSALAFRRHSLGDARGAVTLLDPLVDGTLERLVRALGSSPREARAVTTSETMWLATALYIADGIESANVRLFELIETRRFVSAAAFVRRESSDPRSAELLRESAELGATLSGLVASGPLLDESPQAWRERIVDASRSRDEAQEVYFAHLRERGGFARPISAPELAAHLPADSAAVGFLQYDVRYDDDGRELYLAMVLTPDGKCRRVELGTAAEVRAGVEAWRSALGKPVERGVMPSSVDTPRAAGSALRQLVLDPVLAQLAGSGVAVETLFVCPDDALHLVSFDALPLGTQERVGDRYRIHTEVSFARLVSARTTNAAEPSFLGIGDVDFDAKLSGEAPGGTAAIVLSADRAGSLGRWRRLIGTKAELDSVGMLFEERFGVAPLLLRRDAASKSALFERAAGARYLHVATHGWFAPESILAAGDRADRPAYSLSLEETVRGFAPMTLCGLCLTGANRWSRERRTDGLVTAEELTGLDLAACELAVLSACETNVGVRRAGLGIQSLQAALHLAGARTALTSLWRVDDQLTRELMEAFYTNLWTEGMTKADALWQAKCAMREEGYPVSAWGGWVLTGDPD